MDARVHRNGKDVAVVAPKLDRSSFRVVSSRLAVVVMRAAGRMAKDACASQYCYLRKPGDAESNLGTLPLSQLST